MKNILDFGAVGDGETLNTAAIQSAIDSAAAEGGGQVLVPPGVFISGTIWLRSNIDLHLEAGAVLKGSSDMADYCANDSFPQNAGNSDAEGWRGAHLIAAVEVHDVSLTGCGTIDGNALAFMAPLPGFDHEKWTDYAWSRGFLFTDRPRIDYRPGQVVIFCECDRVRVSGLTFRNCPCWTCHIHGCEDVTVHGIHIDNQVDLVNSDGIDIDCSSRVAVTDCVIRTGDDAITLRGTFKRLTRRPGHDCEDVVISNCVLDSSACAFRIGIGAGRIRNVVISNITVSHASTAFWIGCSWFQPGEGTKISGISISHVRGRNIGQPANIKPCGDEVENAFIRDISFTDYQAECYSHLIVRGSERTPVENIRFRDCRFRQIAPPYKIDTSGFPEEFIFVENAENVVFD